MNGFDGDPARLVRLVEAREDLLRACPEHLVKPQPPSWFEPAEIAMNDQFDGIVRAHKKDRLGMPIQALLRAGAPHHNFELMPLRRLAWFVPTLLSGWLDRATGDVRATDIERICESTESLEGGWWAWTDEEGRALDAFFGAALEAALATALPPLRPSSRPLEDGVQVWSAHAPSVPLEVVRVARAMHVATEPLVIAWVNDVAPLALDHLLEAVFDPTAPAKRWLAEEPVADGLGAAFFDARAERAIRLSKAEKLVRLWIARREDDA